jgi:hypothetical protein
MFRTGGERRVFSDLPRLSLHRWHAPFPLLERLPTNKEKTACDSAAHSWRMSNLERPYRLTTQPAELASFS